MYTQQYDKEKAKLNVPHNYSGNALLEEYEKKEDEKRAGEFSSDIDCEKDKVDEADEKEVMAKPKDKAFLSSVFRNLPFSNLFGSFELFKGGKFNLGSEEIIIIAVSAFLIFTKGADTELGVMLLLLLFIS